MEHLNKAKMNRAKGEINTNTIIVGDLDTQFSAMNRSFRQNREITDLNNTIDEMDLIDIYILLNNSGIYIILKRTWSIMYYRSQC